MASFGTGETATPEFPHRFWPVVLALFTFMFIVTTAFATVAIIGQNHINSSEHDIQKNQVAIASARQADANHLSEVCRHLVVVQANQQVVLSSLRDIRNDLTVDRSVSPSVRHSLADDFKGVEKALRRVELVPC